MTIGTVQDSRDDRAARMQKLADLAKVIEKKHAQATAALVLPAPPAEQVAKTSP